jgi:hypothetical protein
MDATNSVPREPSFRELGKRQALYACNRVEEALENGAFDADELRILCRQLLNGLRTFVNAIEED